MSDEFDDLREQARLAVHLEDKKSAAKKSNPSTKEQDSLIEPFRAEMIEILMLSGSASSVTAEGSGKYFNIKKIDASSNTVTVDGNASTIDGSTTQTISSRYDNPVVQCDGSNWYIL